MLAAGVVDLDVTIIYQIVLFLLFIFFMNVVVFKPWLRLRKKRWEATAGREEEAAAMVASAEKHYKNYQIEIGQVVSDLSARKRGIRQRLQEQEAEELAKLRGELFCQFEEATRQAQSQAAAAKTRLEPELERVALQLAQTLARSNETMK